MNHFSFSREASLASPAHRSPIFQSAGCFSLKDITFLHALPRALRFLFLHSPYPADFWEYLLLCDLYSKDLLLSLLLYSHQTMTLSCPPKALWSPTDCTHAMRLLYLVLSSPSHLNSSLRFSHTLCSSPLCWFSSAYSDLDILRSPMKFHLCVSPMLVLAVSPWQST